MAPEWGDDALHFTSTVTRLFLLCVCVCVRVLVCVREYSTDAFPRAQGHCSRKPERHLPPVRSQTVKPYVAPALNLYVFFLCVCVRVCSIYRCEALEEIVSHTREGKDKPDEFVRIDISGKAFVYVR